MGGGALSGKDLSHIDGLGHKGVYLFFIERNKYKNIAQYEICLTS
jgi:hypothetical protein